MNLSGIMFQMKVNTQIDPVSSLCYSVEIMKFLNDRSILMRLYVFFHLLLMCFMFKDSFFFGDY
ncbi:hypothetical protein HanPSC8_Chr17g0773771 [Helianthus annuus]|nr:hypothetical protein HanPSC8_Chr17g0773771 [Helianthus annuus]